MKSKYAISIDVNPEEINGHVPEYRVTGNRISCNDTDSKWLSSTNNWSITNKDLNGLGFKNFSLDTEDNIDLQDKKLYRYPKLDLPRQKVDLLKDKFNCKVIRDRKKADIHVISFKFLDDLITTDWGSSIDFSSAFQLFKFMKTENLITPCGLDKVKEIVSEIPHDSKIVLQIRYYNRRNDQKSDDIHAPIRDYADSINTKNPYTRDYVLKTDKVPIYNSILNGQAQVVTDIDICNIIDQDLAVLDTSQYKTIHSMIISNDIDNRSLALEMLSNCNINKSFDVVSSLYYWNWDWLKSTNNWNTVNVKAFRKRMKSYEGGRCTTSIYSFNNYIQKLIDDHKLTQYAVDETRKQLPSTLLDSLIGKGSDVFKVDLDSLQLSENLNNKILIND